MLDNLKNSIEHLIAEYETIKVENGFLKSEVERLSAQNQAYNKQNTKLEEEIDNLKLAQAFISSSSDNIEAKDRIDKLIKSIDKCIELMKK